jgi:6-phosphogluconolactonase
MSEPEIRISTDIESLSQAMAAYFAGLAEECKRQGRPFYAAISGGGTPRRAYELLAQAPYAQAGFWSSSHFFWCDERCVPPDHPESNFGEANRLFLTKCGVPQANLHRVQGELVQAQAAMDYHRQLKEQAAPGLGWPRFDLVWLGLGADGHTASLFPGSNPAEGVKNPVLAVCGDYQGRPAERITLTQAVYNTARQVVFMVSGEDKATAVRRTLKGELDLVHTPAQRVRPEQVPVLWMLDKAAARLIEEA